MNAQNVSAKWVRQFGTTSYDEGTSMVLDNKGNIYVTGTFQGTADFDPGSSVFNLSSIGYQDIFISKFDSTGQFIWAKQIGGNNGDNDSYSITVDDSCKVYVTGSFAGTADFDPSVGTFNMTSYNDFHDGFIYYDVFVLKLDSSGNFVWAKQFGGASHDMGHSITVDAIGNIYTVGEFQDSVDFDPGLGTFNLTAKSIDVFVSKLDPSGNFIWVKKMGGSQVDWANAITLDKNNDIILTGGFQDTVDFDPGVGIYNLNGSANYDMFVSKLDSSGNFIWAKRISNSVGKAIAVDTAGNVHTTGYFFGVGDFDPGISTYTLSSASTDIFISKLDVAGNFIWAKQISGVWDEIAFSIALDLSGNVYTTGFFQKITDFDPGVGTYTLSTFGVGGTQDIFISKLDALGNFVWVKQMGGTKIDIGNCIAIDALENIYTTGQFNDIVDFDPNAGVFNLTSNGNADVFVHRMSRGNFVGIKENIFKNKIAVYPNPTSGIVNLVFQNSLNSKSIKLISVTGIILMEKINFIADKFSIDISLLADGIYFLEINNDGNVYRTKLLKN